MMWVWLKRLLGFRRSESRVRPGTPAPVVSLDLAQPPHWSQDDAAILKRFLESATGHRLQTRFSHVAFANTIKGCQDSITTTHSAGKAAGFLECWQWLQSLSTISLSHAAGDSAANDTQAPEGEALLRDRWSP